MATSVPLDMEVLKEVLGPDVEIVPLDQNSQRVLSDDDEENLITLHDVQNEVFEKQSRLNAIILDKPGGRHPHTPPTVSKPDPAKAKELSLLKFDKYLNLKPGAYAEPGTQFMQWKLVEIYPHAYIGKTNRAKAAYLFEEILNGFPWDFFYLYHPRHYRNPAKLFVPTEQFVRFLDFVNATIGIQLAIPEGLAGKAFRVTFKLEGCNGPRYAGRITHSSEFEDLVEYLPDYNDLDSCRDAPVYSVEDLISKLAEWAGTDEKDQKKESAARLREGKAKRRLADVHLAQHLLGLRPDGKGQRLDEDGKIISLEIDKAILFKPYDDVIFMAIDVEADELNNMVILEIGIAVLDTRDLSDIAPGRNGENWFSLIKGHHLHTFEHRSKRNSKFVAGVPDMFDFGKSEQPREAELAQRLRQIINSYINPTRADPKKWEAFRNLILVGHDFNADLRYLDTLCVKPSNFFTYRGIIDTQEMDQVVRDLPHGRSLGGVLNDIEISNRYLHNAGNDAVYTLQAMLALAIEARLDEVRQVEELERELGPDGPTPKPAPEKADVLKDFDDVQFKKTRPGESRDQWTMRIYGY